MGSQHLHLRSVFARVAVLSGLSLALVGITDVAQAEPSSQQLKDARAMFDAGLALEAAGDFKAALLKFRKVAEVRQTPQVTFHIGRCLEELGRWTEALGTYRITIDRAREADAENVVINADEAREALEARMPKVQIIRGIGAAGAVVELDGVRIGAASFGVKMPADPGGHRVVATIDGQEVFSQTVVLKEGRVETVRVSVEGDAPSAPTPKEEKKPVQIGPSERTGYIFLGAGITSIVVGGMFVKLRNDTINQLDEQCIGDHCPSNLEETSDRGKVYTMAANAFLGAGVLSAGIGTVILLQSDAEPNPPVGTKPAPGTKVGLSAVGPGDGAGATVWGKF